MDERAHIGAAFTYLDSQDMRLNPEHPPLFKNLAGIPLLFLDPVFPYDSQEWRDGNNEQWSLGVRFIHENDARMVTQWSRFPIILVGVSLGLFLFYWTKKRSGVWAGLAASALFFFDPNVIAHGHYVTTDMGMAAFTFFALFFFLEFLEGPCLRRFALAALFLGLAQLSKFSAIMLYPYFGLLAVLWAVSSPVATSSIRLRLVTIFRSVAHTFALFIGISLVSFVPIWLLYAYNTANMPMEKVLALSENAFRHEGPDSFHASFINELSGIPVARDLTAYFLGLFMVFVRVEGGNTFFFMGEVLQSAKKSYFPLLFALKETLPFLVIFIISLGSVISASIRKVFFILHRRENTILMKADVFAVLTRRYFTEISLTGFILMYGYISITSNLNIGLRHLFPIFPMLAMLSAISIIHLTKRIRTRWAGISWKTALGALFVWVAIIPIVNYPSYLSYFNEIAGGSENGYKYAVDSNYDWGQDLLYLKTWIDDYNQCLPADRISTKECSFLSDVPDEAKRSPIGKIRIDYFGGADPRYYFADSFIQWHADSMPEPGWYALSAEYFQENLHTKKKPGTQSYEWITRLRPVGRAGDSIFLYYVEAGR